MADTYTDVGQNSRKSIAGAYGFPEIKYLKIGLTDLAIHTNPNSSNSALHQLIQVVQRSHNVLIVGNPKADGSEIVIGVDANLSPIATADLADLVTAIVADTAASAATCEANNIVGAAFAP